MRTGTILADRYQLDDPIAAGGVGQVWRATDLVLQRPIAIKLLRPEYADHHETLSRFRAEARHAGSLAHPGIAQVYDFGDNPAEGPPYLVMELVDGPSLADVLATEPVTPAYALEVLAKAATGLAAAHEAGLVHRDIKPGNILLGRDGQVKITDFGIAHAVGSAPVTDPGLVMGTTQYLAPERIAGGSGTPAADLYSLGIVMHECLNGVPPYEGTPAEVMAGHLYVPLPPLPDGTPPEVTDLVARLTAKDPEQRITDANELAALAQAVHNSITGGQMPRQRQAPAMSPASGVAAPVFPDPARMPRTGDHQVPHTGDLMLDPGLTAEAPGEHPYAGEPVVGGFRVDAPGPRTPDMPNPYEDARAAAAAWDEPGDGHGTVAVPPPGPDPVRETSIDLAGSGISAAGGPGLDETSVDLAGLSHIQAGADGASESPVPADSPGARTTSVDMASLEPAGAAGPADSGSPHGALLDTGTDPFATEDAFTGGHERPRLQGTGESAGRRPHGRRRAAIGIGVVLLAGGGLAGAAASGVLHASPAADTNAKSHQPLSAVQPNAASPSTPAKTAGATPGKHGKAYAARHAKTTASAPPPEPATSSAPVEQQQTSSGSSSSSSGGSGSGGSSPSAPKSQSPQPSKPAPSSSACLLGVLCSS